MNPSDPYWQEVAKYIHSTTGNVASELVKDKFTSHFFFLYPRIIACEKQWGLPDV